jgi:hypothetical protein
LFDIQTYAQIVSDSSLSSIVVGDYVKGNNSGSNAFIKGISGQTLTLTQVSGSFIKNETLSINGISSTTSIGTFTNFTSEDIKSLGNNTFTADTVLSNQTLITGPFTLSVDAGIGTLTSDNGASFASGMKIGNIIKFSRSGVGTDIYSRITGISTIKNSITINSTGAVANVPGVCFGDIGVTTSLQSIYWTKPDLLQFDDSSLTANLNNQNISNVDLTNSNIYVKVSYSSVSKSSTTLTLPSLSGSDYVYSAYDSERYIVVNANNSIENLDSATFTITSGGKNAEFTGLSAVSGPCKVITTQIKSNVSQKFKKYTKSNSIVVSKTKYTNSPNAGLAYSSIYGTRVEDDQISLNTTDIVQIQGIFESSTSSDPSVPFITIANLNNFSSSDDLIVGELVVGVL